MTEDVKRIVEYINGYTSDFLTELKVLENQVSKVSEIVTKLQDDVVFLQKIISMVLLSRDTLEQEEEEHG